MTNPDIDALDAAYAKDSVTPPKAQGVWNCKIGQAHVIDLPPGSDMPMRRAVQDAYFKLTGQACDFTFSGWSAHLTETELAVVEDRLPEYEEFTSMVKRCWPAISTRLRESAAIRTAAASLVEACEQMIEDTAPIFAERQLSRGAKPYSGRQIGEELDALRAALGGQCPCDLAALLAENARLRERVAELEGNTNG